MFTTCTHTLESGSTCKSPAVRGTSLCFNHTPHEDIQRKFPHESEPFELPKIHSKSEIVVALSEVLERFALQKLKRADARTLLYGFSLAARIMTELDQAAAADPFGHDDPLGLESLGVPEPVAQSKPSNPAATAPKSNAPWPGSKDPQLIPLPPRPFNPLLRNAGINDEPSFLSTLCAKANEAAKSQPTQRVHR